jgi:hypothetical protein
MSHFRESLDWPTPEEALAPADQHPQAPPLRIHHLLVWSAVTAVLLSACLTFDRTVRNGPPIENAVVIGALVIITVSVSGAVSGLCWGLGWRWRGIEFPSEPGEWLIVLVASFAFGYGAILLLSLGVFVIDHELFPVVWLGLRLGLFLGMMGTCAYEAWFRSDALPWRILFMVLAITPIVVLTLGLTAPASVAAIVLVTAIWNDLRQGRQHRWTHWLGAGIFLAIVLSCTTMAVLPRSEHAPVSGYFY